MTISIPIRWSVFALLSLLSSSFAFGAPPAVDPLDWPTWRGPEQNGVSRETGLVSSWDPAGENLLWKSDKLRSRSTPIVMRGKLYILCNAEPGSPREGEKVVCADAASGEILWENRFNVYLSDVPDTRVGWSSCVGDPATGRVYALGVCGYFTCIDGETGKTVWSRSLHEEFGLLSTYGGRTNVPVVFEDLVIISAVMTNWGDTPTPPDPYLAADPRTGGWNDMARPAHRFLGLNKATGEVVWFNGTRLLPEDTTYSTPFVTVLNGQAALVFGSADGSVHAMQPRTGKEFWRYQLSKNGLNCSPVVVGEKVYMGNAEENIDDNSMGSVVAINAAGAIGDITKTGELWRTKQIMVAKSSPLVVGDRIYAIEDRAKLIVLDIKTGAVIARQPLATQMHASPLYADGKIYATTVNGRCFIIEPTAKGVRVIHKVDLPEGAECQGSPIASHGRVYIPTTDSMYCLGTKDHKPAAAERPALAVEKQGDATPAHVQVVPADALLKPGQQQKFTARVFNAQGQLLSETPAQFQVQGPGEISSAGVYTAASTPGHTATMVAAKVGALVGKARIRVVPALPWKFDFNDGLVPVTWVGARYRHQPRVVAGEKVMVKITTIPKGARSRLWMGHTGLHDYTVQADVMGALKDAKMPDIGLINQRYTLDMMGANQQVHVRTWDATITRMRSIVPFAWKPNVWYTQKMSVSLSADGKQAVVRGKIWPRGEAEPAKWTVEAIDESPNLNGSPGLYGNAKDAEISIDNVSVTPNAS